MPPLSLNSNTDWCRYFWRGHLKPLHSILQSNIQMGKLPLCVNRALANQIRDQLFYWCWQKVSKSFSVERKIRIDFRQGRICGNVLKEIRNEGIILLYVDFLSKYIIRISMLRLKDSQATWNTILSSNYTESSGMLQDNIIHKQKSWYNEYIIIYIRKYKEIKRNLYEINILIMLYMSPLMQRVYAYSMLHTIIQ